VSIQSVYRSRAWSFSKFGGVRLQVIRPSCVPLTPDQRICRCAHRLVEHSASIRLPLWGMDPRQGLLLVSRVDSAPQRTVVFRFSHGRVLLATVKGDKVFKLAKTDTAWTQMMLALAGNVIDLCYRRPLQPSCSLI